MTRLRAVLLAVALLCPATMAQADVVLKWNEIAVKTMIQPMMIHYRFDQVVGSRLGREIATSVYKNNLRKAKNSK